MLLTGYPGFVPLSSLFESHQSSEVSSENGPAEGGRRVNADQAADEGVLAALQQSHDVRAHVIRVLFPEVLSGNVRKVHIKPLKMTQTQSSSARLQSPSHCGTFCDNETDLNPVLDFASIVLDDEGRLHDGRELDVPVALMLPPELIQEGLVGGLRETGVKRRSVSFGCHICF